MCIRDRSSIEEVYEDSEKEFEEIGRAGNGLLAGLCEGLMEPEEGTVTVWNTGGMAQSGEAVLEDGQRIWAEDVPPWGWKKFALSQAVSYTHLDVYKRQRELCSARPCLRNLKKSPIRFWRADRA